ncbi:hypothetical protein NEISICOT_02854 [Neisseria sicca ATCC 29256]|uniref:Uncharacterized protein n=1 Tax=Neisseria sicca ATCC 29256 TaxID=547045 RepID=C6M8I1_NEISI|nr:hypothetical protein NEISICOT_02854 [Neisseria sicca ATCC 29256]
MKVGWFKEKRSSEKILDDLFSFIKKGFNALQKPTWQERTN